MPDDNAWRPADPAGADIDRTERQILEEEKTRLYVQNADGAIQRHLTSPADILVADLFCGAGGSSTRARKAIEDIGGRMELVAVNHWNTAIATHQANHPEARHLVEDVSIGDPEALLEEGRLDILMASPECTYHSRARGGKPIHDQDRMNPWAVHNWLTKLDVNCVLIENLPEFTDWGPLDPKTRRPIKSKKAEQFMAFHNLGYQAE